MPFRPLPTGKAHAMSDRIDDVAAGDLITLKGGDRPHRVVHIDRTENGFLVTLEPDGGEIIDVDLVAGTAVTRALESKWDSPQSPTPDAAETGP